MIQIMKNYLERFVGNPHSFQRKIITIYLVLTIIPMLLIALIITGVYYQRILDSAYNILNENAQQHEIIVQERMENYENVMYELVADSEFINLAKMYNISDSVDELKIKKILSSGINTYDQIRAAVFLSDSGNGAGKSTTLNAIAGVWGIDKGNIIIDGTDITKLSEHKRALFLGRVFQDPMTGTAATMSIEENMAIAARRGQKRGLGCQVIFTDDLVGECKYFCGSLWIKSGCMLIKEQKFRLFKGSHQKCDCLTLSAGEETNLKVSDLLAKFEEVSGGEFANDRMMLS